MRYMSSVVAWGQIPDLPVLAPGTMEYKV